MKRIFSFFSRSPIGRRLSSVVLLVALTAVTAFGQGGQSVNVIPGNAQVTVKWAGMEVASIDVMTTDFNVLKTIAAPTSPLVITGLTNGQLYKFKLNQPDGGYVNAPPPVGTWAITHRETGYDGSVDLPAEAEAGKLTFLPEGKYYGYEIDGLYFEGIWELEGTKLTLIFGDGSGSSESKVLDMSASTFTIEALHYDEAEDYYNYTFQKISSSILVSVYGMPGVESAPQNVRITPVDGGLNVSWEEPVAGEEYDYYLIADGQKYPLALVSESSLKAGTSVKTGTVDGLTNGQAYQVQLVAVRQIEAIPGTGFYVNILGYTDAQQVTVSNEVVESAGIGITAYDGRIVITTSAAGDLKVYTIGGQLYRHQLISAGTTSLPVAKGLYIVVFGDKAVKVLVR